MPSRIFWARRSGDHRSGYRERLLLRFLQPEKHKFTPEEFDASRKRWRNWRAADLPIVREEMSKEEAIRIFREMGETYKVELIEDLPNETVSLYRQGTLSIFAAGRICPLRV
jgi:threonyl-tRNA synthetase